MTARSDETRAAFGFLTAAQTDALADAGVRVLDPGSTLVARRALLAPGVVLYPGAVLECDGDAYLSVGARTRLHPGTRLAARAGGRLAVGEDCELGPGGVQVCADGAGAPVVLAAQVRLSGGCELSGPSELGRGSQILGAVSARGVVLGGGRGGHAWPVPDERGAVLKGTGLAAGVRLAAGEVRSSRRDLAAAPTERQADHHPGSTTGG